MCRRGEAAERRPLFSLVCPSSALANGPNHERGRREITATMLGRIADFGFYEIVVPSPRIGRDVLEARLSLTTTDPP